MSRVTLTLITAILALPAAAAPAVDVTITVEREITVVADDGRTLTHREPVRDASPGDVLVYTLNATNVGSEPARNTRLDDPIPSGTELIPESVTGAPATVLASLDDGRSWDAFPRTVETATADGGVRDVPAPGDAYTHLRWVLPGELDPGESRAVTFKVRIR